jgi:hypothetical protein
MPQVRWLLLICLAGCDAHFVDLRPAAEAAPDLGGAGFPTATDLPPAGGVFARGTFTGRAGHGGSGTATLERTSDGSVELVFGDDFSVTAVPGPVVVLTAREELGTTIAASDLEIGVLSLTVGAQRYRLANGDGGRRNVFVFCKPFGVEVAKADLEPLP